MNDRKESLKIKNQKSKCLFPRGRDIQHNYLCNKNVYRVMTLMKTIYYFKKIILIPIYLPGSTNLGRVVYAKDSV